MQVEQSSDPVLQSPAPRTRQFRPRRPRLIEQLVRTPGESSESPHRNSRHKPTVPIQTGCSQSACRASRAARREGAVTNEHPPHWGDAARGPVGGLSTGDSGCSCASASSAIRSTTHFRQSASLEPIGFSTLQLNLIFLSVTFAGLAVGAAFAGWLSDRLGRPSRSTSAFSSSLCLRRWRRRRRCLSPCGMHYQYTHHQ